MVGLQLILIFGSRQHHLHHHRTISKTNDWAKRLFLNLLALLICISATNSQSFIEGVIHDSVAHTIAKIPTNSAKVNYLFSLSQETEFSTDQKIHLLEKALDIAIDTDSVLFEVKIANELARLHWHKGNPEISLDWLFQGLSKAKNNQLKNWESYIYENIGNNYMQLGNYQEAEKYIVESLELKKQIFSDTAALLNSLLTYAECLYQLEKYAECKEILGKVSSLILPNPSAHVFYNAILHASEAYLFALEGKKEEAISNLAFTTSVLSTYNQSFTAKLLAQINYELARIFHESNEIQLTKQLALNAYDLAHRHDLEEEKRDVSALLRDIYLYEQLYDSAYLYQTQYFASRDSIINLENVKKIEAIRADYEIGQKQSELDMVDQQRRTQQVVSISIGGFLLIALIFAVIFYRNYRQKLTLSKELAVTNQSKDKLMSIISHDLRGPMAGLSGVSFMIRSSIDQKDMLHEIANEVEQTSRHLSNLLENLLHWAIKDQGSMRAQKESLSVKQLFKELEEMYRFQAKEKAISMEVSGQLNLTINADRNQVYTIFRNLISNALKFTPQGGRIMVESQSDEKVVEVKISDTGVGIPKDKLSTIFEFSGEKPSFGTAGEKGLGLGLSLVKDFVNKNKGTITVESEAGNGTTFIVQLPVLN